MDHKLTILFFVTLGVGYVMTLSGVRMRTLRWRSSPRRCPSCGWLQRDCGCMA